MKDNEIFAVKINNEYAGETTHEMTSSLIEAN